MLTRGADQSAFTTVQLEDLLGAEAWIGIVSALARIALRNQDPGRFGATWEAGGYLKHGAGYGALLQTAERDLCDFDQDYAQAASPRGGV